MSGRYEGAVRIPPEGFGLVFMGGGAKGAYQLGVWQALRELDIPIKAVTGTSIGSINGAFVAQGDFDAAVSGWHSVQMSQVVAMEETQDLGENLLDPRNLLYITKKILTEKGLDNAPLKEMLSAMLDEEKIRASGIDFGLTVFSVADHSLTEIFVSEIPQGQLIDYVMASACFPIFKSVHIGDDEFVDGGFGDVMPVKMLLERGCRHILTVDIGGVGFRQAYDPGDAEILTIRHSLPLGGLFDVSHDTLNAGQHLGYLDTLRLFGRMRGRLYFFPSEEYEKLHRFFSRQTIDGLEEAARLYELPQGTEYTAFGFLLALIGAFEDFRPRFEQRLEESPLEVLVSELQGGLKPLLPGDGALRLHSAMETAAAERGVTAPGEGRLLPERERRAAEAILTLVRLGIPDALRG